MSRSKELLIILVLSLFFLPYFSSGDGYWGNQIGKIQGLPGQYTDRDQDQRWNQFFDANQSRQALSVIESRFGGFAVTGLILNSTTGIGDEGVWVARTDSDGNIEWEREYAEGHRGWGEAIVECQNGDFVIAGVIDDEYSHVLAIRTNAQGNLKWERTFNFTQHQEVYSVTELSSGNLVLCGWVWHYRPTNPVDGLVVCLTSDGSLLWFREYGGLGDERFYSVTIVKNNGLAFSGLTESYEQTLELMWIVKTDFQGQMEWNASFGGSSFDRANCIISNQFGELTVAGVTQNQETERLDAVVIHISPMGTKLWNQTLGLELNEAAHAIITCSDGGYAVAGEVSQSEDSPWNDLLVVRLNEGGEILWKKHYGGEGNDIGVSLVECMEGDFVLAGSTSSYGYLSGTAWLLRVPDAPPPPIDPRQVNAPLAIIGLGLAVIVLSVVISIFLASRREYRARLKDCN